MVLLEVLIPPDVAISDYLNLTVWLPDVRAQWSGGPATQIGQQVEQYLTLQTGIYTREAD